MKNFISDIAFSPAVKSFQAKEGSRKTYQRMAENRDWRKDIDPGIEEFITTNFSHQFNPCYSKHLQLRTGVQCTVYEIQLTHYPLHFYYYLITTPIFFQPTACYPLSIRLWNLSNAYKTSTKSNSNIQNKLSLKLERFTAKQAGRCSKYITLQSYQGASSHSP